MRLRSGALPRRRPAEQHDDLPLPELSPLRWRAGRRVAHLLQKGFRYTQGQPGVYRSTAPVRRSFCAACGTPLTYEHEKHADTLDATTCSLDEPDAFAPTHHSWLSHDLPWVKFGDGLPAYPEWRS